MAAKKRRDIALSLSFLDIMACGFGAVTLLFLHYFPQLSSDLVAVVNGATCAIAAHNGYVASRMEGQASE